jgi:hypothetical protein
MQIEVLRTIEAMSHQRLNLVKQFSAHSAAALQCLDGGDVEGFVENVEKGDALIPQIDKLTAEIETSLPQMGIKNAAALRTLIASGAKGAACPAWCAALASDWTNMEKLLHSCIGMNARMEARVRALSEELRKQISHIRANQKLQSRYIVQGGASGARINYTSK